MKRLLTTMLLLASFGAAQAAAPDMPGARERAPLSIAIDGAKGTTFRLVYAPGSGWKFADHVGPRLASADHQGPTGPIPALPTDAPQGVFVDGPSGYVFVYVIDEGWRFVGSVAATPNAE